MSGQDSGGSSLQDKTQAFLREFFAQGEVLVRELIHENERLRQIAERAKEGGEGVSSEDRAAAAAADRTGSAVPAGVVTRLMEKIDELEDECAEIRRIVGSVRRESGGYRDRLDGLEREHYQLASMYVAANQFHAATTMDEVLRTVTEILLNFVGIGQFTLYIVDETNATAFPVFREGGEVEEREPVDLSGSHPMATLAGEPRIWRPGDFAVDTDGVLMLLPLVSGVRLVGVASLEGFLPQKAAFEENDGALLELISEHAGIGIESAWMRHNAEETPMRRETIQDLVSA